MEHLFDVGMPIGTSKKYPHECAPDRTPSLVVTRTPTGWVWFCHRCRDKGARDLRGASSAAIAQVLSNNQAVAPVQRDLCLPEDFSHDIPAEALSWLWRFGILSSEITSNHMGYSSKLQRLILPIYNDNSLAYWIGRFIPTMKLRRSVNTSKYLCVRGYGRKDIYYRVDHPGDSSIVVVEDILSAIKVARHNSTLALLHARITPRIIGKVLSGYSTIKLWLDPDKEAHMFESVLRYRSLGYDVRAIFTAKDPKYYNDEQIEGRLK